MLLAYLGTDTRLRIIVGDPKTSIDGTVMEGYAYLENGVPTMIYDQSGRPDVYPWHLVSGPVLRIYTLDSRGKATAVYAHPEWTPRHGA